MARFGCYRVEKICPCLWLLVFNRILGWFQISHLMFLIQEFFSCLLSLLPAVQHLERSKPSGAGAPIFSLFCDATPLLGPWNNREMITILRNYSLFQRVLASSSEWVVLLVSLGEVKRPRHNAHHFFTYSIVFKPGHQLGITEWRNKWRFLIWLQYIPSGHNRKISVT